MSAEDAGSLCARRRPVPRLPRRASGRRAVAQATGQAHAADVRAFMAARRSDGARQPLADARCWPARAPSRASSSATARARSARSPPCARPSSRKTLPKPLAVAAAKRITDIELARRRGARALDHRARCRRAGAALRLGPAHLGSARRSSARISPAAHDAITVTGKGNKTRMVPLLPQVAKLIADYVALCPFDLPPDGPLFVGARGGPLSPRIVQLAMARLARRARPARHGDAARAAPFLRHASAGARRRPARHPGTARPRLAVDHADLHRGRCRAFTRRLCQRPSARVT